MSPAPAPRPRYPAPKGVKRPEDLGTETDIAVNQQVGGSAEQRVLLEVAGTMRVWLSLGCMGIKAGRWDCSGR